MDRETSAGNGAQRYLANAGLTPYEAISAATANVGKFL
jgi:hypothetical protein